MACRSAIGVGPRTPTSSAFVRTAGTASPLASSRPLLPAGWPGSRRHRSPLPTPRPLQQSPPRRSFQRPSAPLPPPSTWRPVPRSPRSTSCAPTAMPSILRQDASAPTAASHSHSLRRRSQPPRFRRVHPSPRSLSPPPVPRAPRRVERRHSWAPPSWASLPRPSPPSPESPARAAAARTREAWHSASSAEPRCPRRPARAAPAPPQRGRESPHLRPPHWLSPFRPWPLQWRWPLQRLWLRRELLPQCSLPAWS